MGPFEWLELAAGIAIIALIQYDVFSAVIVPRQVSPAFRFSSQWVRASWVRWRQGCALITDPDKREDMLARYAPFVLVALLVGWLAWFIIGYGLVFYALREHAQPHIRSFLEAMYYAGTTFLTIGYGDIVTTTPLGRFVSLAAGATGLALFATLISFIFSIFGSFQRREIFIVKMGSRAGAPPSGVTMLETALKYGLNDDLAQAFRDAEDWAALVLESHLAYPVLAYFRSSHDDESWIGTLGAMLDASTMLIALTDSPLRGRAKLFHTLGVHLVGDLSRYFHIGTYEDVGIERHEFDEACAQLTAAGLAVTCDDAAWQRFSELRRQYSGPLNAMAQYWLIPPTRWMGDRSAIGLRALHAAPKGT